MRCQRLPSIAAGQWTLWFRTGELWRFAAYGTLPDMETKAAQCQAEMLILPPGECPVMARKDCHRT